MPSSRRRVDGVEIDAAIQDERASKFDFRTGEDPNASRRDVDGLVPLQPGLIEVIEGFSTELTLPEKVDLCVFEICGSLASEAGFCVEINQCVGCCGEEQASPRHRAGVASMA
jgi:hypothetical protein